MKRVDVSARQRKRKDKLWAYETAWRLIDSHIVSGSLDCDTDEEYERQQNALREIIHSLQDKADRLKEKGVNVD